MNFWNNLFLSGIRNFSYGSIEIEWPNGKVENIFASKTGPIANLKIADDKVVKEIINGGSVKFAELYMAKRLTSSNLTTLMYYFALNNDEAEDTFKVSILKYFFNWVFFNSIKKILKYLILSLTFFLCFEFILSTHFHSIIDFSNYNTIVNEIDPQGNYGLSWSFESQGSSPKREYEKKSHFF